MKDSAADQAITRVQNVSTRVE